MPQPVSELARRLGAGPGAMDIHDEARRRVAAGRDVLVLTVGDTDIETPACASEAGVRAIMAGRTHYPDKQGEAPLRAAIAARHEAVSGVPTDPDQVVVTAGAQQAVFLALLCLVGPGDEVLLPQPSYLWHAAAVRAAGAVPVPVPLCPDDGFALRPGAVDRALSPRTKAFLFNTPHNPSGRVFGAVETEAVAEACVRADLWCVSDEVYGEVRFGAPFHSPSSFPGMAERTVTVGSLSKSHAMTGWRVGHMLAPRPLVPHLGRLASCANLGVSPFVQDAAVAALLDGTGAQEAVRAELMARRDLVVSALDGRAGLRAPSPESGPFVLLDVRGTGLTGAEFCWGLLDEGVALVPGEGYGAHGHARLSLSVPCGRLEEACRRILAHAGRLRAGSRAGALTAA